MGLHGLTGKGLTRSCGHVYAEGGTAALTSRADYDMMTPKLNY